MQALCTCLAAPNARVVLETLQTLVSYVRRSHSSSIRFSGFQSLSSRLIAFAKPWPGREEVKPAFFGKSDVIALCTVKRCTMHVSTAAHWRIGAALEFICMLTRTRAAPGWCEQLLAAAAVSVGAGLMTCQLLTRMWNAGRGSARVRDVQPYS